MKTIEETLDGMDMVEFLYHCRKDFKFFCERLLGLDTYGGIQEFHLEWFKLLRNHNKLLIQAPSGFAKTTIFEAYALWLAFNFNEKKILIVANTLDRAKRILAEIKTFIGNNAIIDDLRPKNHLETWNTQEVATTTKCRIFVKPYTENMRGERVDFALLDEADSKAYNNISIFNEHVLSRLNPGAQIALISTPESPKYLMSYIRSTDPKEKHYKFKKYTAIVNYKKGDLFSGESIWPERFPIKELKARYESMTEQAFLKIYMCDEKTESEESIFKLKDIMSGYDSNRKFGLPEDGLTIMGCDFAYSDSPRADFDAYAVIEKKDNFFILRHLEKWKGIKPQVKISRIEELNNLYKPALIVCDESNIGSTVIDEMYGRGLAAIRQKFSASERKDLLLVLQNVVRGGRLIIPRDSEDPNMIELTSELTEQLLGFVKTTSEQGTDKIESHAAHDDLAMAVAMAVKEAARQVTDSFFEDENPEPVEKRLLPLDKLEY